MNCSIKGGLMTIFEVAENFFKQAAAKTDGEKKIAQMSQTVQFVVKDKMEEAFYLEAKGGKLTLRKGQVENPDTTAVSTTQILQALFEGEVTPTEIYNDSEKAPLYLFASAERDYRLQWLVGLIRIGQGKYWW